MNKHRAKCNRLKAIRKGIADKLGVDLHQKECTFEGECTGTCPKCKQEEDILNKELFKRAAGLGIGTLAALSLAGCGPVDPGSDIQGGMTYSPQVEYPTEELSCDVIINEDASNNTDTNETDTNETENCDTDKKEPNIDDPDALPGGLSVKYDWRL